MNQYKRVMYDAFRNELEKTSSAKLMKAIHDAMGSGTTSKKSLAMLRKRGIIDAADDAAEVSRKAQKYFKGLEFDLGRSTTQRQLRAAANPPQKRGSEILLDNMFQEAKKDRGANKAKIRQLIKQKNRQRRLNKGQNFVADPTGANEHKPVIISRVNKFMRRIQPY